MDVIYCHLLHSELQIEFFVGSLYSNFKKNENMSRLLFLVLLLCTGQTTSEQVASEHLLLPATDGFARAQIPIKVSGLTKLVTLLNDGNLSETPSWG